MNQSKAFLTSLIFAGLAMALVYLYVSEQETSLKAAFGTDVTVVVAARDINEFEEIQANMLATKTIPSSFVQPGAQSDPSIFTSSGSVAASPMRKGEQILLTKVLLKGAETGLASQVAIARRALSIPVSDVTGVTRLLKPGDRVDIVSNVLYQTDKGQQSEVKTILQDVHVLAVGEVIQNNIPSVFEEDPLTGAKKAVNLRGNRAFNTVTVEVSPLNAQSLIFVIQTGAQLFLTLRNPVDRVVIEKISTTTVDEVLGPNSKKNRPVALPPAPVQPARQPASKPKRNPWLQGGGSFVN